MRLRRAATGLIQRTLLSLLAAVALRKASPDTRAKACQAIREREEMCAGVAPLCPACDPNLYKEYSRREKASEELFKHASDLRLRAYREAGGILRKMMVDHVGILEDQARDLADIKDGPSFEDAWEAASDATKEHLKKRRTEMSRTLAKAIEIGEATVTVVNDLIILADMAYRGSEAARQWRAWMKEADTAEAKASDMWQKALAAFKADLKQAKACAEESRRAAAEERSLDEAKRGHFYAAPEPAARPQFRRMPGLLWALSSMP